MFKEMNFAFAHRSSNPICPAMQSVSATCLTAARRGPPATGYWLSWPFGPLVALRARESGALKVLWSVQLPVVTIGVVTTTGKIAQTRNALDSAIELMR
jgi:hypothetical protein